MCGGPGFIFICWTPDPIFLASLPQIPVTKMWKCRAERGYMLVLGIRKNFMKEAAFAVGSRVWEGFWQAIENGRKK